MLSELGTVVEADGFAQELWDRPQPVGDTACGELGLPVRWLIDDGEAGLPFVKDEDVVAIFGEQHVIGFPMAWLGSIGGFGGPFGKRHTQFDEVEGTAALTPIATAPRLVAGQQAVPIIFLRRAMVDVAID
jgi:hypothetical protein